MPILEAEGSKKGWQPGLILSVVTLLVVVGAVFAWRAIADNIGPDIGAYSDGIASSPSVIVRSWAGA